MMLRLLGAAIAWAIVGFLGLVVVLLALWLVLALAGVVVGLAVGIVP